MLYWAALIILGLTLLAFFLSRGRALSSVSGEVSQLHSRPVYHGAFTALWTGGVGFIVLLVGAVLSGWLIRQSLFSAIPAELADLSSIQRELLVGDAIALAEGRLASQSDAAREMLAAKFARLGTWRDYGVALLALAAAVASFLLCYRRVSADFRARNRTERLVSVILQFCAAIAILTTLGIVASLLGETLKFFSQIPVSSFLFGTKWSPLSGVFEGTLSPDNVGAVPLFAGTLLITLIAMLVAVPVGLFAAVYLSDYASNRTRAVVKPVLELLAGIPTVVYGFFAAITVAPFIRNLGESLGLSVSSESALAAGIVMGIMIIPFISSLSDDVINAVPQSLRDGSYGLGATKAETVRNIILPAALPGIVSAVLLGVSRAIGETMIVVMAAGQGANLTANPLEAVTTVTVQIVALISGDTEASTAAGPAFSLGFTLFCVTLIFNVIALRLVNKYREQYD